jgi:hypothetical protein
MTPEHMGISLSYVVNTGSSGSVKMPGRFGSRFVSAVSRNVHLDPARSAFDALTTLNWTRRVRLATFKASTFALAGQAQS